MFSTDFFTKIAQVRLEIFNVPFGSGSAGLGCTFSLKILSNFNNHVNYLAYEFKNRN